MHDKLIGEDLLRKLHIHHQEGETVRVKLSGGAERKSFAGFKNKSEFELYVTNRNHSPFHFEFVKSGKVDFIVIPDDVKTPSPSALKLATKDTEIMHASAFLEEMTYFKPGSKPNAKKQTVKKPTGKKQKKPTVKKASVKKPTVKKQKKPTVKKAKKKQTKPKKPLTLHNNQSVKCTC